MDHIRQMDWRRRNAFQEHFVSEDDIDNCATTKIIHGVFVHPYDTIEYEEQDKKQILALLSKLDARKDNELPVNSQRIYVPGLRQIPPYPQVSCLTQEEQFKILKVLAYNHHFFDSLKTPYPTREDKDLYEKLKDKYSEEQKKYIEWANTMWKENYCVRALRPKVLVETVFDAKLNVGANLVKSLPQTYEMAALIQIATNNTSVKLTKGKLLNKVEFNKVPIMTPPILTRQYTVITNKAPLPQVCQRHPCKFLLPGATSLSSFSYPEILEELGYFGIKHNCELIVSESALNCMIETDRAWTLPVMVLHEKPVVGYFKKIVVIGEEMLYKKKLMRLRTAEALHLLTEYALTRNSAHMLNTNDAKNVKSPNPKKFGFKSGNTGHKEPVSSDEEDNLVIVDDVTMESEEADFENISKPDLRENDSTMEVDASENPVASQSIEAALDQLSKLGSSHALQECACNGSLGNGLTQMAYVKWTLGSKTTPKPISVIVYHPVRTLKENNREVVLNTIPEYQLELGATVQSIHKQRSLAFSLFLRENSSLLTARVDANNGDIVTMDWQSLDDMERQHKDLLQPGFSAVSSMLTKLLELKLGHYLLSHEVEHSQNVMLFVPRAPSSMTAGSTRLALDPEQAPSNEDEAKSVQEPPTLGAVLLPSHRFRKILPLAFTYDKKHVKAPKVKATKLPRYQPAEHKSIRKQRNAAKRKRKAALKKAQNNAVSDLKKSPGNVITNKSKNMNFRPGIG